MADLDTKTPTENHLVITGNGKQGTVTLGGVELQNGIVGLNLTLRSGELPTLRLDPLVVTSDVRVDGPVTAIVMPAAHDVLVALGWTPPEVKP